MKAAREAASEEKYCNVIESMNGIAVFLYLSAIQVGFCEKSG
jgi:hypothetical protein